MSLSDHTGDSDKSNTFRHNSDIKNVRNTDPWLGDWEGILTESVWLGEGSHIQ